MSLPGETAEGLRPEEAPLMGVQEEKVLAGVFSVLSVESDLREDCPFIATTDGECDTR